MGFGFRMQMRGHCWGAWVPCNIFRVCLRGPFFCTFFEQGLFSLARALGMQGKPERCDCKTKGRDDLPEEAFSSLSFGLGFRV